MIAIALLRGRAAPSRRIVAESEAAATAPRASSPRGELRTAEHAAV